MLKRGTDVASICLKFYRLIEAKSIKDPGSNTDLGTGLQAAWFSSTKSIVVSMSKC